MESCPLCNPTLIKDQQILLSTTHSLFLQLPQEVLIGSGLIVPKVHRETVFDLTSDEWNDTYHLLQAVKKHLDTMYLPQGYNIGWNCGEIGGQHIMHAHLHVIPRFEDEPFAGKGIRHWLKSEQNKRFSLR